MNVNTDGAEVDLWELRGRISAAAQRVRTNPDTTDPEWNAALTELTEALRIAEEVDPIYREAAAAAALEIEQELSGLAVDR